MRAPTAVVAGLALGLGLFFAGTLVMAAALQPAPIDEAPLPLSRAYLSGLLALAFASAVAGGFASAHLASATRFRCAVIVATLLALYGVLTALVRPADMPEIVAWLVPVLAAAGALGGGALRTVVRSS